MLRLLAALACALTLASCGADRTWAPDDQVAAAHYVAGPPASITLVTVINDRNGSGAHSGLIINGSERVLFDPAGTFYHPSMPIRNDVHYGLTDRMYAFYLDYHTRDNPTEDFHVIESTKIVPLEVANLVLQRAKDYGAVPKAYCSTSISNILNGVPGFEGLKGSMFPKALGRSFDALPGVSARVITQQTDLGNHGVRMVDDDGNLVN